MLVTNLPEHLRVHSVDVRRRLHEEQQQQHGVGGELDLVRGEEARAGGEVLGNRGVVGEQELARNAPSSRCTREGGEKKSLLVRLGATLAASDAALPGLMEGKVCHSAPSSL